MEATKRHVWTGYPVLDGLIDDLEPTVIAVPGVAGVGVTSFLRGIATNLGRSGPVLWTEQMGRVETGCDRVAGIVIDAGVPEEEYPKLLGLSDALSCDALALGVPIFVSVRLAFDRTLCGEVPESCVLHVRKPAGTLPRGIPGTLRDVELYEWGWPKGLASFWMEGEIWRELRWDRWGRLVGRSR